MTSCNQGGHFVCRFVAQSQPEFKSGVDYPWLVDFVFENLSVDQNYFDQCLKIAFLDDENVSVEGNKVTVSSRTELELQELSAVCEKLSAVLLGHLSKHSKWGFPGGPDHVDERLD
ncbi:hypothetical protein A2572_04955 [Candidatus Collierbacteria bacterium RIFOXYD1_FULL_40_9]|uniref:Uncharacterized protein n=1 Tax=Candidatus Collierbacteria bacterium RIFOXYD1_FULL_40_9 TaxID=1817731 RepID=A0A1F5FV25_9BACT|nr:MAG: hypothetical protein A2572_04955 [Candidatus Collierbacteria bacterium RIFOXYD1_FULL_40_9]